MDSIGQVCTFKISRAWRGFGISFGFLVFVIKEYLGRGANLGHRPTYSAGGGECIYIYIYTYTCMCVCVTGCSLNPPFPEMASIRAARV